MDVVEVTGFLGHDQALEVANMAHGRYIDQEYVPKFVECVVYRLTHERNREVSPTLNIGGFFFCRQSEVTR